eukprot:scaffold259638_cov37-Tisochrysis_lutea.AAC.5
MSEDSALSIYFCFGLPSGALIKTRRFCAPLAPLTSGSSAQTIPVPCVHCAHVPGYDKNIVRDAVVVNIKVTMPLTSRKLR